MILFKKTAYTDGLVNLLITSLGGEAIDFIDGEHWAKMLVLCIYTVWTVLPFKILIFTSALASVDKTYYQAAAIDGTPENAAKIVEMAKTNNSNVMDDKIL